MSRQIRFAQYGIGRMGRIIAEYAIEKGAQPVAGFVRNPMNIGKDMGEFIGIRPVGVPISAAADAARVLQETRPDICIIATESMMKDVEDILMVCAENGINAITTCDEALYPGNSSPSITDRIDAAAREHNCTITGSGANEAQYGGLFALFGGNIQTVRELSGSAQYDVEDYGESLAYAHGVGLTTKEFDEKIASLDRITDEERTERIARGDFLPANVWNANGWICDFLDLEVVSQKQICSPVVSDKVVHCEVLDIDIPAGDVIGMESTCVTETKEGITVRTTSSGFVYSGDEEDTNILETKGVPDSNVYIRKPDTVRATCAIIVNRIPDVISAGPGFVPTSRMPVLKFKSLDLGCYVG